MVYCIVEQAMAPSTAANLPSTYIRVLTRRHDVAQAPIRLPQHLARCYTDRGGAGSRWATAA